PDGRADYETMPYFPGRTDDGLRDLRWDPIRDSDAGVIDCNRIMDNFRIKFSNATGGLTTNDVVNDYNQRHPERKISEGTLWVLFNIPYKKWGN
ncbi:MAG: hypothetical protein LBK02_07650, partial [Treponema sp.]|nr:hypothetical protein [Treponema sp.]